MALRAVQQVFATAAEHTLAAFVETGGTVAPPPARTVADVAGGSATEG